MFELKPRNFLQYFLGYTQLFERQIWKGSNSECVHYNNKIMGTSLLLEVEYPQLHSNALYLLRLARLVDFNCSYTLEVLSLVF